MRRPATRDSVVLSASSAFAVCDGLLRMAHCLIVELPESELRDIRYTIDILATRTNQILGSAERDLSLNFDRLAIIPDIHTLPGAEDFGALLVPNSVPTDSSGSDSVPSPCHHRNIPSRTSAPVTTPARASIRIPTPAPVPAPASSPISSYGSFPLTLSSRDNVGFPNWTYHPPLCSPWHPGCSSRGAKTHQ